jgi:hypothetical protein
MKKWPYKRGDLPWEGQLSSIYYLSTSEILLDADHCVSVLSWDRSQEECTCTVMDLPIGSTGLSLEPQNLGASGQDVY